MTGKIGEDAQQSSHHPKETIQAILCHIKQKDRYLLQLKSKGRFGGGLWNAPGGKVKIGETADDAVKREIFEETGLVPERFSAIGLIEFYNGEGKSRPDWAVKVYLCTKFSGYLLKEGEEGRLEWVDKDKIPYAEMWPDDKHWLPLLLEGKKFHAEFHFAEDGKTLLSAKVSEL